MCFRRTSSSSYTTCIQSWFDYISCYFEFEQQQREEEPKICTTIKLCARQKSVHHYRCCCCNTHTFGKLLPIILLCLLINWIFKLAQQMQKWWFSNHSFIFTEFWVFAHGIINRHRSNARNHNHTHPYSWLLFCHFSTIPIRFWMQDQQHVSSLFWCFDVWHPISR